MGNYKEISSFLSEVPDSLKNFALSMLEILPDKDLRDSRESILSDHLRYCPIPGHLNQGKDYDMFIRYVLNPRVANENLVAWRSYFFKSIPPEMIPELKQNPIMLVKYVNDNFILDDTDNYYKTPLTPRGVNALKITDSDSRAIFFVSLCRTFGIPARLEPGNNIPQFYMNNEWHEVYFSDQKPDSAKKGFLKLTSSEKSPVPEYYTHFTLARFENGRYNTLEYDYNRKISEFSEELALAPGNYLLVTGNRMENGDVLSGMTFFNLSENEHKTLEIKLRKEESDNVTLGTIDINAITKLFKADNCTPERITSKGIAIIWIDPEKEPTKHVFNDLPLLKEEFDSWGGYFLFLTKSPISESNYFRNEELKKLPENSLFGVDADLKELKQIIDYKANGEISLPYVLLLDKNTNILFTSSGYRVGIGDIILKKLLTTVDI